MRHRAGINVTSKSLEIFELRIPLAQIVALAPHQRYAYYLLGQIYNEMIVLQKIIAYALPKHDDERPSRRNAEIAQVYFLFRMAASKIYEAKAAINRKEVHTSLNELVFPSAPHLRDFLRTLNKAVSGADWMNRMRNGMGFHYPGFNDWTEYTTPDATWIDDMVYFGKQSGNTFFDASATVAMHWMFDKYREHKPTDSVNLLVNEMIDLIKLINSFTNETTSVIISKLVTTGKIEPAGKVIAPVHSEVSIPYWTSIK
jgi:hypothetical protein